MTIDEHLHFSVLSAPVASFDRRALSQAWYSALYGTQPSARGNVTQPSMPASSRNARFAILPEMRASRAAAPVVPRSVRMERAPAAIGATERRAPRSLLARRIERAARAAAGFSSKTAFTIEGTHGRVRIFMHANGSVLRIIALCAPNARTQIAAALAQARYTLARVGIRLETDAREEGTC